MPRNKRCRRIQINPEITVFKPVGVPRSKLASTILELDELEALRLKDAQSFNQEECAKKMKVSTSTFQRILNSAHQKVAQALLGGNSIIINKNIMSNRDGTGPQGQGPRTGRGMGNCGSGQGNGLGRGNGQGRGVNSPRQGAGVGGSCVCPKCGEKLDHVTGQPCYQRKCPKCDVALVREA